MIKKKRIHSWLTGISPLSKALYVYLSIRGVIVRGKDAGTERRKNECNSEPFMEEGLCRAAGIYWSRYLPAQVVHGTCILSAPRAHVTDRTLQVYAAWSLSLEREKERGERTPWMLLEMLISARKDRFRFQVLAILFSPSRKNRECLSRNTSFLNLNNSRIGSNLQDF